MKKSTLIRAALILGTCAAVLGVTAGSVLGSVLGSSSHASRDTALVGKAAKLATFDRSKGYGVFVQKDGAGDVCLLSGPVANSADRRGGCNPASSPLGGNRMLTLYTFDGGPAVQSVTDARVAGLVSPSVAKVVLVLSDGTTLPTTLENGRTNAVLGTSYNTYAVDISDAYYAAGVSLSAVVGYDGSGHVVQQDKFDDIFPK